MNADNFNFLTRKNTFKVGFRSALSLIISDIVNDSTALSEGETPTYTKTKLNIDLFEFTRREKAYALSGQNANIDRYIDDLRPMFPPNEANEVNEFFPFELIDGELTASNVEDVLYGRMKEIGYFNYLSGCKPEMVGVMWDTVTKAWGI